MGKLGNPIPCNVVGHKGIAKRLQISAKTQEKIILVSDILSTVRDRWPKTLNSLYLRRPRSSTALNLARGSVQSVIHLSIFGNCAVSCAAIEKKDLSCFIFKGSKSIPVSEEISTNQGDGTCPTPGCDGTGHVSGQWKTHYTLVLFL